jgi:hypothetical protein
MRVYNMWRRATGASHLSQAAAADLTQGPSSRNLQTSHQTQTLLHSITRPSFLHTSRVIVGMTL